jgi:preprotein translocase subunit SecG
MNLGFLILTIVFIIVSAVMVLIVLVQRPQGGGLAGAFGGAGGSGTDTVFGGRVGDALTVMTVAAFLAYLGLAIGLNLVPIRTVPTAQQPTPTLTSPEQVPVFPADGPPPIIQETLPPPVIFPPADEPVEPDSPDADFDVTPGDGE